MVIVPLDEASKAIYGEGEEITNTTATLETEKGISFYIEENKLKPSIDFKASWELIAIDKPWIFDNSVSFTDTSKMKWKDKIDAALGFTHYVKKGKLYRK